MEIVVTTNSPGELQSWVRCTVAELRRLQPDLRVTVALVPCPYASGAEARVARAIPGVDRVLTPMESVWLALGRPPEGFQPGPRGVVVFLGGEPWHALLLARALGYPAVGYIVRPAGMARNFRRVAAIDSSVEAAMRRMGVDHVTTVGNLTLDSVSFRESPGCEEAEPSLAVGLFPGSRGLHLRASLGVFLRVAEVVHEAEPTTRFLAAISPFVGREDVQKALDRPIPIGLPRARACLEGDDLVTERGVRVRVSWGRPYDVMEQMTVGLTIPGTNTAEMACFGRPMVVVMSASAPVPRGGLGGVVDLLPVAASLKRRLRRKTYRRFGLVAQPNRMAGRMVVPEVVAEREVEEIAGPLLELLRDPVRREELGRQLVALTGGRGACQRMAELILEAAA